MSNSKIIIFLMESINMFKNNIKNHTINNNCKPLGRWCHEGYDKKCNFNIKKKKIDFANLDNNK